MGMGRRRCPRRKAAAGRCAVLALVLLLLALGGSGTGEELLSAALAAWLDWAGPPRDGAEGFASSAGFANSAGSANGAGFANGAGIANGANSAGVASGVNGAGIANGADLANGAGVASGANGAGIASGANGAGIANGADLANGAGIASGANGVGIANGADLANGAGVASGANAAGVANGVGVANASAAKAGAGPAEGLGFGGALAAPSACGEPPPFLLVLVASAPGHAAQRQAVRETWGGGGAAAGRPTRTLFGLGVPAAAAERAALAGEASRHGDLLQGAFADTYRNLTRKTLLLLGWAAARCPGARFVLKADDDVYVNVPALVAHLGALGAPRRLYLGRVHWRVQAERDPRHRHHVPAALYPAGAFPPYCSGTAYVLSGDAVGAVLAAAPRVPPVAPEDVFVGLCARRAGLAPRHSARMAGAARFPLDPCCYGEVLLSAHRLAPGELRRAWALARAHPRPCSGLQRALGMLRCSALAALEWLWR